MQRLRDYWSVRLKGEQFLPNAPVPADEKQLIPMQLVNTIIDIEEQASYIAEVQKGYKEQLKSAMRENGVKSWDASIGCVLAILPLQRVRVLMQRSFRKITRNYILNI